MKKFKDNSNIEYVKVIDSKLKYDGLKETKFKEVWFLKEMDSLFEKGTIVAAVLDNDTFTCLDEYKENLIIC